MRIGSIELENPYILAPMAGVSDMPYRRICHQQGAGLLCTEMISAKALTYHNRNTEFLLAIHPDEYPVSLQLFGSEPVVLAEAARQIAERPFQILDLNMGCPVPKIVKNREGAALMNQPALVYEIVSAVVRATAKPVTVKIRKGFDDTHVNAVEIARICEAAGASAITVHGRTREQFYAGTADWDIIRQVKAAVKIPVIGNGDVTSPQAAQAMQAQTGCDGVMIGRAAQGNPWIFREMVHFARTGEQPARPALAEIRTTMLEHARLQREYKGAYIGIREMRKHIAWYTKGLPGAARIRDEINRVETYAALEELIMTRLSGQPEPEISCSQQE